MRRSLIVLAVAALAAPMPAAAHDHEPPRITLRVADADVQDARPVEYCWAHPHGTGYVETCPWFAYGFDEAVPVPPRTVVAVRFHTAARPSGFSATARSTVDRAPGEPRVALKLAPVVVPADGLWEARFVLPLSCSDVWLDGFAEWPDVTFGVRQWIVFTLHPRTTSGPDCEDA